MRFFILIIICFFAGSHACFAQRIGSIQYDTVECDGAYNQLDLKEQKTLTALKGVENFLTEILGTKILKQNLWLDYCESQRMILPVYSKDRKNPWISGNDTCYDLKFYFLDNNRNNLGVVSLLVDKNGLPTSCEYMTDPWLNNFALLKGLKSISKISLLSALQKLLQPEGRKVTL